MNNLDRLRELIIRTNQVFVMCDTLGAVAAEQFELLEIDIRRCLAKIYGTDSEEIKSLERILCNSLTALTHYKNDKQMQRFKIAEINKDEIETAKRFLETLLEELELEGENNTPNTNKTNNNIDLTKVFIVHGHDGEIKQKVARLLEKQGIQAIILDEQINAGKTIIEKFEQHSNVGAAICLFTADDTGKANKEEEPKPRARQNVVLETGFFMGKLGRERLVIIAEKGIELPSDMQGIVYINNNWEFSMLKELKNMGFNIDMNKLS